MSSDSPRPFAPWWQFSLRWVFIGTAILAVVCAFFARNWVRQAQVRALTSELRGRGHAVYDEHPREPKPASMEGRSWLQFFTDYPSIRYMAIRHEDRNFASFPWASLRALGELEWIGLDHPELRDEHLAEVAAHQGLRGVELVCNPHITRRGTDSLRGLKGLSEVSVQGRSLPSEAWGFLEQPGDGAEIVVWLRPEQLADVSPHLRDRWGLDVTFRFEEYGQADWPIDAPYSASLRVDLSPGVGTNLKSLAITGGWVSETELVRILEESPDLESIAARVDRVSAKLFGKARPQLSVWLNTLELTADLADSQGTGYIQVPRFTPELADALRRRRGSCNFSLVIPRDQPLPADMRGLTVDELDRFSFSHQIVSRNWHWRQTDAAPPP